MSSSFRIHRLQHTRLLCPPLSFGCAVLSRSVMSTLCNPIDCSPPASSVHEDPPSKNTSLGCHALLQGIFLTQGSNPGLPHYRWILYHLSLQGSPSLSLQIPMLGLELCVYGLAHFCPQNYTKKVWQFMPDPIYSAIYKVAWLFRAEYYLDRILL